MAKPDNPFFARALVNRMWGHFLGRGLFHEVDDQRETNPPSNPELLDALAKDFIAKKFDVKHIIRTIVTSRVYQLSSTPTDDNKDDRQNFARYYARRMPAEVFLDAVNQATGAKAGFNGVGIQRPGRRLAARRLRLVLPRHLRPAEACHGLRVRTLHGGDAVAGAPTWPTRRRSRTRSPPATAAMAKLVKAKKPIPDAIEELYLAALSRVPTDAEKNKTLSYVDQQTNKQQALEDVLWALVNSKEFMFNH